MAVARIVHFEDFLNQQIKFQEKIQEYLSKAEAQIEVALLSDNFYTFTHSTLHNYFWGMADLLKQVISANQASLQALFSIQGSNVRIVCIPHL
jgi:hypothetical protein